MMNPQQADPLAQLRDIHLPDPVSAWPPGPGLWVLAISALLLLTVLSWWLWRRHRANAYRRQAKQELAAALHQWQQDTDNRAFALAISDVLKRVALLHYPRVEVAGLSGERWCQFLDRSWRRPPASGFSDTSFAVLAYATLDDSNDIEAIYLLSQRWLQQQRRRR